MYIYFVTKRANEKGYFSHNLFYNQKHYDYTLVLYIDIILYPCFYFIMFSSN